MGTTNPQIRLMQDERSKINFNVEEITNLIDGSKENTELRRKIVEEVQSDPIMGDLDRSYKTNDELYITSLKRAQRFHKIFLELKTDNRQRIAILATGRIPGLVMHDRTFVNALKNLASPEQFKKWIPLAEKLQIIGSYAQTELGHGSNLRKLETTAKFVKETQEFVINTPSLTSMKWWPGDLAKSANHAVVMANLLVDGQEYGMHPFMVQIRDLDTHMPLPGVKVGSIGDKYGFDTNDNGFLILNNIRIPRENMLAGVDEIDTEGNHFLKSDPRILYAGMLSVRVLMLGTQSATPLQQAVTIATRYSIVRRQGNIGSNGPEVSVMEYITQQHKILPLLAASYAYHFTARRVQQFYKDKMESIRNGDFSELPELHALCAGMKAYMSERCLAGSDICRRACGGHGYLKSSGFPHFYLDQMAIVTLEGDNTVMYLQCARYLIKQAAESANGKKLKCSTSYLNDQFRTKCPAKTMNELCTQFEQLQCFKQRAASKVRDVYRKMEGLKKSGYPHHEAWNMVSVELVEATKAHLEAYVMSTFINTVNEAKISENGKKIVTNLRALWGLHTIIENIGDFLKDGYFDRSHVQLAKGFEIHLLGEVKKYALGLVDAFEFTDKTLHSCLGAYDGNVYERLYENALRAPENKEKVHKEFYKIFQTNLHKGRDILRGAKSKL